MGLWSERVVLNCLCSLLRTAVVESESERTDELASMES